MIFIITMICNCIGQVARVAKLQLIVYIVQLIAIQLKQVIFNYYSIPLQLHPWCHADVINCYPSINILHMALWKILDIKRNSKYWSPSSIMIVNKVWDCNMWHNKKLPWYILEFKKKIKILVVRQVIHNHR
jgi:hypothetical protein